MSKSFVSALAFFALLCSGPPMLAQEQPKTVTPCDLAKNPKSYNGETVRVRGALSVEFEDFTLVKGRDCPTLQSIWLAFGGDVPGIVASTVNDTSRKSGTDLKVNGVSFGVKKDENFRRLYALIAARKGDKPAYFVTATLEGAFFAGEEQRRPDGQGYFAGYGHLGCCALFVITQVSEVESVPPANLNIQGTVLGPDRRPMEGFEVFDDVLGGSPPERQQTATDEHGKFEFSNSGSMLLFKNPAYRPLALAVKPGGAPVHVRLEEAKRSDWIVPSCEPPGASPRRIGFEAQFVIPAALQWEGIDEEGKHADDHIQAYFVFPRGKEAVDASFFITLAEGEDDPGDFVGAKWSEQRWIKTSAGNVVGVDSRAQLRKGIHWRNASFFDHESVGYTLPRGTPTTMFDGIIDSACRAEK